MLTRYLLRRASLGLVFIAAPAIAAPGAMRARCLREVVPTYAVQPSQVKLGALARQKGGGSALKGTVDKGAEGIKPFQCMFDRRGRFRDVMSLVDEGAL